jgi:hypothetical protein
MRRDVRILMVGDGEWVSPVYSSQIIHKQVTQKGLEKVQ